MRIPVSLAFLQYLCIYFLTANCYAESELANKKLPPSVVVAFTKESSLSTTNLHWEGKDTPLHSGDVAKSMLQIPAFSMTRKGGGGSEIAYRSQSAGRLPIFINGGNLNGACSGRMDTTITYIFPQNYDKISFFKGPQDVRYGALIGGGLLFERKISRLDKAHFETDINTLFGSFGRFDINANVLAGGSKGSLQAIYSHYQSKDYHAGDSRVVHSAYDRESISLIGTLTPTAHTALEFDVDMSRGRSSYADRAMDARTFDRISYNFAFTQHFNNVFDKLEMRIWHNEIDHIMDNFSYRPVANMDKYRLNNPKRTNTGARLEGRFYIGDYLELHVGGNYDHDTHSLRSSIGNNTQEANAVLNNAYDKTFTFENLGAFTQGQWIPQTSFGISFGMRYDTLNTTKHRDLKVSNSLYSGFMRYEHYFDNATFFAGIGIAQRGADFWERSKNNGLNLKPETNTQLDIGFLYKDLTFSTKISAFVSHIDNYMLLHYATNNTSAFNTNAYLSGGELEAEYTFWESWHIYGSLSYTYAQNLKSTNQLQVYSPLPQIAPLQAQISGFYDNGAWLVRLDAIGNGTQHRYALDYGNVIGKDLGNSMGFITLNLYGGYKHKYFMLMAGVDNITNTLYAYHLSKNGVEIGTLSIAPTHRIYEPGRNVWAKIKLNF